MQLYEQGELEAHRPDELQVKVAFPTRKYPALHWAVHCDPMEVPGHGLLDTEFSESETLGMLTKQELSDEATGKHV